MSLPIDPGLPFDPVSALKNKFGLEPDSEALQDEIRVAIGPYMAGQLRVVAVDGREAINGLYEYDVTCTSRLPLEPLHVAGDGLPACLTFNNRADHEPHLIQGIAVGLTVLTPVRGDRGRRRFAYRFKIVHKLWLLTQRRSIRIFQRKTPKQIIVEVLATIGVLPTACQFEIDDGAYPELSFHYQRCETDYEFFCRVLSWSGIVFCFEHARGTLEDKLPGASSVIGAVKSIADAVGGPMASAVEDVAAKAKMFTLLRFTDKPRGLPAVQDMAALNEAAGKALTSALTKLGGSIGKKAAGLVENSPPHELPFDDDRAGGGQEERIITFELERSLRPKKVFVTDRDVWRGPSWAGIAERGPIDSPLGVPKSFGDIPKMAGKIPDALPVGIGGPSIGRDGLSVKAHLEIDLDVDSPAVPTESLLQRLYQIAPNLREYPDKQQRIEVELARLRVDRIVGAGTSDCRRLGAGYRIRMRNHPLKELNREYIVTALEVHAVTDPYSDEPNVYQSNFKCVPVRVLPLPARSPAPRLPDELARVVAVEGIRETSRLDTNAVGHVHIIFDWDVADERGTQKEALPYGPEYERAIRVPVSQPWAGDRYGIQCLPREGMRVWVGYLEGQGERPFVKGCFYDDENQLPGGSNPLEWQKVGIFSRTLPENGGWSEVSMSDREGGEVMHLRAQRDFQAHVLHNSSTHVEGDSEEHVQGSSIIHVDKDLGTRVTGSERRIVQTDRYDRVGGLLSTTVGGAAQIEVAGGLSEEIGERHKCTLKGSSDTSIEGNRSTTIGSEDVLTVGKEQVVTVGSHGEPGKSVMYVVDGTYRRSAKKMILEAEDIVIRSKGTEIRLTPEALTVSASTIHETASKELRLRGKGSALKLHAQAEVFSNEVNVHGSKARLRLGDTAQVEKATTPAEEAVEKTSRAQLESRYALELFEKAAERIEQNEFAAWLSTIYGADIPVESYQALHRDLRGKSIPNPRIVLSSPGNMGGERGTYNNDTREIHISKELPRSAESSERDAATLFLVLLHELGHHVDNLLRKQYTQPPIGGDTPGEEGARFAYAVAGMDHHERDHVIFATHTRQGQTVPLKLEYKEFHVAVKNYVEKPDAQNKARNVEGFDAATEAESSESEIGAGTANFFTHHNIELALREADVHFYTNGELAIKRDAVGKMMRDSNGVPLTYQTAPILDWVYFGNWLRDNSQICAGDIYASIRRGTWGAVDAKLARDIITSLMDKSAKGKSKAGKFDFSKIQPTHVTPAILGVYRPEEHIDNPKGLADGSPLDSNLRGPVLDFEFAVDQSTGLKNYIKNTSLIASERKDRTERSTTLEYIEKQLHDAADAALVGDKPTQFRLLGQALHPLEDFYTHSNFVELMLIRLGHKDVFPWVGRKAQVCTDKRFALVTGNFGDVDEKYSLLAGIADGLNTPARCVDGVLTRQSKVAFDSMPGSLVHEAAVVNRYKMSDQKLANWISESNGGLSAWALCKLSASLQELLALIAKAEKEFIDKLDSDVSDPSHSMLSKDHHNNPLHVVAAKCARVAITHVGRLMRDVWTNKAKVKDVVRLVDSFLIHPNDLSVPADMKRIDIDADPRNGIVKLISESASPNMVEKLNRQNSIDRFMGIARARNQKTAQLLREWSSHDADTQQRIVTLIPSLQRYSVAGKG